MSAEGKNVVVIGGGDTGTDCIGTSMRQRCKSVVNLELMPRPPESRSATNPWPEWPRVFGVDYGHAEAASVFGEDPRKFSLMTTEFKKDAAGRLVGLSVVEVKVTPEGIVPTGPERTIPCELAILAMGFVSPELKILGDLKVDVDQRNNVHAEYGDYRTSVEGVFAAGDCRRGQSLVVWAINEGRGAAASTHNYLEELARRQLGESEQLA